MGLPCKRSRIGRLVVALALLLPAAAGAQGVVPGEMPPAAPSGYPVFFHPDADEIPPHMHRIILQAAQRAERLEAEHSFDHIKVIGYSGAVSAPDAAQKLSLHRAQAIKDVLVSHGVPADRIAVEGRGRLRTAPKPGEDAREPTNRRARIVIYQRQYP